MENVEIHRRYNCIAQGILLIQKAGFATFFSVVPGTPFIHIKAKLTFRIVFVQHSDVVGNVFVDAQGALQRFKPHGIVEVSGMPFLRPFAGGQGVEVIADAVHITVDIGAEYIGPLGIFGMTAATD